MADPQSVASRLGRRLGRPIGVDDTRLRILAYTSAPGIDDEARRFAILNRGVSDEVREWVARQEASRQESVFVLPARPEIGLQYDRWGAVARTDGKPVAYVWVLVDDGELTTPEQDLLLAAAQEVGDQIGRQHLVDELKELRERESINDLLGDDAAVRGHAAQRLADTGLFEEDSAIAALVLLPRPGDRAEHDTEAMRAWVDAALEEIRLSLPRRGSLAVRRSAHGLLVVAVPTAHPSLEQLGESAHKALTRTVGPGYESWVGISSVRRDLTELAWAYDEARRAAEVSAALRALGPIVYFDRMGIYRRIATLIDDDSEAESIHPGIRELLVREANQGDPLAQTLEMYLDNAGDANLSAQKLHLHRASLYARLRRIESITELNLNDGQDRLFAHLELKLARLGHERRKPLF